MITRLLLLALSLSACGEPVRLIVDGSTENIEEACDVLGIVCDPTATRTYGAIELRISDVCDTTDEHVTGYMEDARCLPRGCAADDPAVIAHEIAHAFDLEHVEDADNLMTVDAEGFDLTDEQLDTIVDAADRFVNCR